MSKIEIKNKKFFKSKLHMVIFIILFTLIIYLFILIGKTDFSQNLSDNELFVSEYKDIDKDNVFKYINVVDAHMIANGKEGIVFFCNKSNPWCLSYAQILNQVAKDAGIKEILYYDFYSDREQNNATYEDIVENLKNYVTYNDLEKAEIYAPSLLVVSQGKVLYFDNETSFRDGYTTPDKYWNEYNKGIKYNELNTVFNEYLNN